jgi:hypothetical protein
MTWTYNFYRALLKKNDKPFAIVTPDGKNALSDEDAAELLAALNYRDNPSLISAELLAALNYRDNPSLISADYRLSFDRRERQYLFAVKAAGLKLPERLKHWDLWIQDPGIYLNELKDFVETKIK